MSGSAAAGLRSRRSLLFTPGIRPDMFDKALRAGADMVVFDLEDSVAPQDKEQARAQTLPLFAGPLPARIEVILRINGLRTPDGLADLLAILKLERPPTGIMIPKLRSAEDVRWLDELLSTPATSGIQFHVIVETAEGLGAMREVVRASPRIASILFGGIDLAAELRVPGTWESLLYARGRVVHNAARAGIDVLDVPFIRLDDPEGLREEAARAAAFGFTGKSAIHPEHIAVINPLFTPTAEQVARARRIVAAFEASHGVITVVDGQLVEPPVVKSMQRILAVAAAAAGRP